MDALSAALRVASSGLGAQSQRLRIASENLANAQSQEGLRQGSDFCPRSLVLFKEVMSLQTSDELPEYAAGKDVIPAQLGACATVTTPA